VAETMTAPVICSEIADRWNDYFANEYRSTETDRPAGNRASSIAHVCENYPLMARRWYEERSRPPNELLSIFRQGNVMHEDTKYLLGKEMRFSLRRSEMPHGYKPLELTGHIDTEIEVAGKWELAEIKSIHPNVYGQINRVEDFFTMKFHVFRAYPGQLLMYVLMANRERGLMILRNKSTSQIKPLWVYLWDHADYAEGLLKRAERVNAALRDGTRNLIQLCDPEVCEECDFAHRCAPPITFPLPLMSQNPAFIALLERRGQLAAAAAEYIEIDKQVKVSLRHVQWQGDDPKLPPAKTLLAGGWIITRAVNKNGVESFKIRREEEPKEDPDDRA